MSRSEASYSVIKSMILSEKSTSCEEKNNQYLFKVDRKSNKHTIKDAVEGIFEVKVLKVNTINMDGKNKMFKHSRGKRQDWKKAYVTLAEGQEIKYSTDVE